MVVFYCKAWQGAQTFNSSVSGWRSTRNNTVLRPSWEKLPVSWVLTPPLGCEGDRSSARAGFQSCGSLLVAVPALRGPAAPSPVADVAAHSVVPFSLQSLVAEGLAT